MSGGILARLLRLARDDSSIVDMNVCSQLQETPQLFFISRVHGKYKYYCVPKFGCPAGTTLVCTKMLHSWFFFIYVVTVGQPKYEYLWCNLRNHRISRKKICFLYFLILETPPNILVQIWSQSTQNLLPYSVLKLAKSRSAKNEMLKKHQLKVWKKEKSL